MVVLAHLQGVAATFRVGRHHHRAQLHEGRGLTHALTDTAPTDLTVAAALVRKACSKRRRSRLWSEPVNLRAWGLVSDSIAIVQAFAELRYGAVVHTRANSVKYGHNFIGQTFTHGFTHTERLIYHCTVYTGRVKGPRRCQAGLLFMLTVL
jgi:hypothetical protein